MGMLAAASQGDQSPRHQQFHEQRKTLIGLSDFEHGFLNAASLAARLGDPNLAAKMLGNAGFQALDCSELNAVDKQQLQRVNQQPGMKLTGLRKHN